MGASKTESFSEEQNQLAIIIKALAHPARIAIIEYLLSVNTCICGDIVAILPLSQPTVSQHLKELKNAQIIQGTIEGTAICYCLNPVVIDFLAHYFQNFSQKLNQKNNSCC